MASRRFTAEGRSKRSAGQGEVNPRPSRCLPKRVEGVVGRRRPRKLVENDDGFAIAECQGLLGRHRPTLARRAVACGEPERPAGNVRGLEAQARHSVHELSAGQRPALVRSAVAIPRQHGLADRTGPGVEALAVIAGVDP